MEERTGMDRGNPRHFVLPAGTCWDDGIDHHQFEQRALDSRLSKPYGGARSIINDPADDESARNAAGKAKGIDLPEWYSYGSIAAVTFVMIALIIVQIVWG